MRFNLVQRFLPWIRNITQYIGELQFQLFIGGTDFSALAIEASQMH